MSYHIGFLYLADVYGNPVEIINEGRTIANMKTAQFAGFRPFDSMLAYAGCPGLMYHPCIMASNGVVTSWTPLDTDITDAPWASTDPAFRDALGFFIEEWTGLDGAHHTRGTTPLGNPPGGARFGPQSARERVMAFNVTLVGKSARGLNYLFRWLESTLLASCSPCETNSLWFREHCPDGYTATLLEEGLCRMDEVALIAGPTWESPPVEEAGCYLRRVSFTLAAGNPCAYRIPATASTNTATWAATGSLSPSLEQLAPCGLFVGSSMQHAVTVTPPSIGLTSPVVTITSPYLDVSGSPGVQATLPDLRIVGFIDDAGIGSFRPCEQRRVGLFTIAGVPSGSELVIDCSTGTATVRNLYTDSEWTDGSQYIKANADYDTTYTGRRNISFPPCRGAYVVVEPTLTGAGGGSGTGVTWSTSVAMVSRFGCI